MEQTPGGVLPKICPYGEASLKGVLPSVSRFMRLRISQVEVNERLGQLVISVCTLYMKGSKGANGKYGCEKVERKTLFSDLFIKDCIYSSEKGCKPGMVCEWDTDYICPKKAV